ncbi:MAG TPA: amino acid adenylation domain-containing protein [Thermoanaerobaculia bacterium]|nr:amino acid adenylation domain-containing protein [Thermoanaerobaculia bacterium]
MNESDSNEFSIAVTGMSGRFPGAADLAAFWSNLRAGVESIRPFTSAELAGSASAADLADPSFVAAGAPLDDVESFDAPFFDFNPREAEITDPQQRLFLECCWEALESAGVDPETFPGSIGVFAGSSMSTYFLYNVLANPEVTRGVAPFQLLIGADKDYLAPRVSYKLDLRGPSVSVQTACSTSLVAVHLGVQSLLDHQADVVLAGGVSVRVPQHAGYRYMEGGIFSPDGHCRPFDEKAAGTVSGSGVGVVVLRRLADALEAGDPILAVIRGSAINNDGASKVGFTAPGVAGQVAVISEALSAAGVEASSLSYVETHGTGTALGDPIEIEALRQAFSESSSLPQGSCAIGSLKSNLGHLDAAAGVAGLIKTVLALKARELPPSLHFERPSPAIDFSSGPFYVNAALAPWGSEGDAAPRRAGVSSFGIGGTNAHVILEQAPAQDASSAPERPWQLLLLSAKSEAALEAATDRLARHLAENAPAGPEWADLAWTLQAGRKRFAHRRALIARDAADAAAALHGRDPQRLLTVAQEARERQVAFLFPGQGAQRPNMGLALYRAERVFRAVLDDCAEKLIPALGLDLRTVLYPAAESEADAAERLERTDLAQPALFAVEYALARQWQAWGIAPAALLGHSIGEYVAACLAGVFSLADALSLVAIRGKLMAVLPGGAMLSVPRAEAEVRSRLDAAGGALALAAVNAPAFCTVSGPTDEIDAFAASLAADGIEARRLHTSHAFHSAAMEPILDEFAAAVARVRLAAPKIPVVSNVTGAWLTPEQATDPAYWARQLRETVRFGDGVTLLANEGAYLPLEVGPGRTLASLVRAGDAERTVISSLPENPGGDEAAPLAEPLARLWLSGVRIDWAGLHGIGQGARRQKVELPSYPFERRRYWIDRVDRSDRMDRTDRSDRSDRTDVAAPAPPTPTSPTAGHPRPALATPFVPPAEGLEAAVAALWQRALGLSGLGRHDDFFELGGHSLLATQLASDVRGAFAVSADLGTLFVTPTIAGMAAVIATHEQAPGDTASLTLVSDPEHRYEPFPLTDVQQAYWIGREGAFELGGVATHMYMEIDAGAVDLERMNLAWRRLIDRHDMLRAVIDDTGLQRVLESVPPFTIRTFDLSGRTAQAQAAGVAEVRAAMSHQMLPADRWPLFDVRATVRDGGRVRFHISYDFLIGDAWSWQLMTRDLVRFYVDPDLAVSPLEATFRDYVLTALRYEETPAFARDLAYWRERLAELPPAPELPLARNPATITKPSFLRLAARVPRSEWRRVKARASRAGLTPSGVLLAAFAEVLGTWSKSPKFTINLTLFNRLPLHPQVGEIVGDFTSLSLLAIDLSQPAPFFERARAIQARLWQDLDHRSVSGVRVMREMARAGGGRAIMPVVFTSTLNLARPWEAEGDEEREEESLGEDAYGISQTPQVWIDHQVAEERGELSYNWDVVDGLFPPGMIQEMFTAYRDLVGRLGAEDVGDDELGAGSSLVLVPLDQLEAQQRANATSARFDVGAGLLHRLIAPVPDETPAVIAPGRTVTYGELRRRSRALGAELRAHGALPNRLIGVVMEKGWEQVVAVLGVHESGAAYLPIDPDLPAERRRYLLDNGEVEIVVTQPWIAERIDAAGEWPERSLSVVRIEAEEAVAEIAADAASPVQSPSDLAYVIFTSGSTGKPKGVMIDHRGAVNTVLDVNSRFGIGPADRVLALSALSFDLSVWDIFGPLAAGGAIVLPGADRTRDPEHWAERIGAEGVSIWNSVPALFEMMVERLEEEDRSFPATLRLAMLSGDWIPLSLPERARQISPRRALHVISMGGATEASIWSILYDVGEVEMEWRSIPYGRAMANQTFYVLDDELRPRPTWVPGQLAIGGIGLSVGYWRDPEKTEASFIVHPRTGERLYRTGDLGRWLPSGEIEFLGREDFQVKIRGFRVELGEIETALARHSAVREAVVIALTASPGREGGGVPGEKRLVAYLLAEPGASPPDVGDLRGHLRAQLPEYMVPASFHVLDAFPLSSNGKVDRKALPALAAPAAEREVRPYEAPRTEVEAALATICSEALGVEKLGVHDDFFALGGDSLMAIRAVFRIRKAVGVELPVRVFFERPNVAELAEAVEDLLLAEIEAMSEQEVEEQL